MLVLLINNRLKMPMPSQSCVNNVTEVITNKMIASYIPKERDVRA